MLSESVSGVHFAAEALSFELPAPEVVPGRSAGSLAFGGEDVAGFGTKDFDGEGSVGVFVVVAS